MFLDSKKIILIYTVYWNDIYVFSKICCFPDMTSCTRRAFVFKQLLTGRTKRDRDRAVAESPSVTAGQQLIMLLLLHYGPPLDFGVMVVMVTAL